MILASTVRRSPGPFSGEHLMVQRACCVYESRSLPTEDRPMLLSDPRLRFARDLLAHWTHIRRDGLVPFEEDLDPRALVECLPFITIADLAQADGARMELVFPEVSRHYGRDIRKADWFAFIVPEHRAAADEAKRQLIAMPCGAYYRFAILGGGTRAVEIESLSLPLRRRGEADPSISISHVRDIAVRDIPDAASAASLKIEGVFGEFVDIGAGAPVFPTLAPVSQPAAR